MNKKFYFLFLLNFFLVADSSPSNPGRIISIKKKDLLNEWTFFKTQHKKLYSNKSHEAIRFEIFQQNILKINTQNLKYQNGQSTYSAGLNRFSDWTSQEFRNYANKGLKLKSNSIKPRTISNKKSMNLPSSVDWRIRGYVNPINDQGSCGSCWAFSAVSAIESFYFKTNGILPNLSEQNLVDCAYSYLGFTGRDADGCQGGTMNQAFNYVKNNNGIDFESKDPYTSGKTGKWNGKCKYNVSNEGAQLDGYVIITDGIGNESALTEAVAQIGPIATGVYVSDNFQNYQSGIFTESPLNCPRGQTNHALNVVGYGTLNGTDYYILRNQWGTEWGMQGYMYFARDTIGNTNQCEIASFASYPIVKAISTNLTNSFTSTSLITKSTALRKSTSSKVLTTSTKRLSTKSVLCINCLTYYFNICQKAFYDIYLISLAILISIQIK